MGEGRALDLMTARKADGANLDFEPMLSAQTPAYLAFFSRFRAAMKARFPSATLVNATSAGAGKDLILGLVPLVDRHLTMTYNYPGASASGSPAGCLPGPISCASDSSGPGRRGARWT